LFYLIFDYTHIIFAILLNILLFFSTLYPFYTVTTLIFNNSLSINFFSFTKSFDLKLQNKSPLEDSSYTNSIILNQFKNDTQKVDFFFENAFYKIFLNTLDDNKLLPTINPILKINPKFYSKLNLVDNIEPNKLDPLLKYLPSNTMKRDQINNSPNFYINKMDFKVINFFSKNKELVSFNNSLNDQLSVINSLRWSYRYSNLHRRTIYNSHKLTESKKLLSSGFFDINITNESLWFSDKYARPLESKKERKSLSSKDLISSN
jgi:hypothetical protein